MEITESGTLYREPLHPYTKALLSSIPIPDPELEDKRERILLKGELPSPVNPPSGCVFRTRCPESINKWSGSSKKEPLFLFISLFPSFQHFDTDGKRQNGRVRFLEAGDGIPHIQASPPDNESLKRRAAEPGQSAKRLRVSYSLSGGDA